MKKILSRVWILLAVGLLPLSVASRIAGRLGRRQYRKASPSLLDPIRALIGSRLGLGASEVEELLRTIFERSALEQLEGGMFRLRSRERVAGMVEIRGLHHLDQALERGQGCILCSGHFRGRWSFFAKLGLSGYRPLLIRQNAPPGMSRMFYWFQDRFDKLISSRFGCRFLWVESPDPFVAAKATAHLRKNGVLINLIDVSSYASRTVDVDFLNKQEPFPIGTVLLSQLAHAPLLGFSIHYSIEQARYICDIEPAHFASDDALASTQRLAAQLEAGIVSHPADWAGWTKTQYLRG